MSTTSIQFIGLFVMMVNGTAGLHILLPHFPGTQFADHFSAIQYAPDQVLSATWPGIAACGPNNSLRCAPIDVETISFTGAIDPPPTDVIGAMPHLQCCCPSMTDILATYKDPKATKKLSAHIFVDQGVAEAMAVTSGRTDTWVTMHTKDPTGITVTGNAGGSSFNIVFKPGAQFSILNSTQTTTGDPHFLAYYLMGIGSSKCTAVPTDGAPCAASNGECLLTKKQTAAALKRSPARTRLKKGATVAPLDVDANCSNSHFP
jgi:hypothetical protein